MGTPLAVAVALLADGGAPGAAGRERRSGERLLPTPDTGVSPNGHGRRGGRPGNGHQSGAGLDAVAPAICGWGEYEPAVRRWEAVLGYPAPPPAEPGPAGKPRLAAALAEWMMGIPGLVTAVPGIPRTGQLRLIGAGVVPQQAGAALRLLISAAAPEEAGAAA